MVKCAYLILCILASINISQCARILGVFHWVSRSHFMLGETLLKELARRGHDVTMISSYPQKTPVQNYRDIPLRTTLEAIEQRKQERNFFDGLPLWLTLPMMGQMGLTFTELTFQEEAVQSLLNSGETFDVAIVEQFVNDAHKGFAYHFNASLIVFSTIGASVWTNHLVGNPTAMAYTPEIFLGYSSHMTFFQRLVNTVFTTFEELYNHLYLFKKQDELLHKYIPNAPSLYDIMYNTSLMLLNSHVSFESIKPYVPNMIDIGGFHVKEAGELTEDLKQFLDNSKEGVIYFSLGSNLKSKDMSKEKIDHILKVIGKLKMKVLWKFEADSLPYIPKNLKIGSWFPQQSILAHPNVKLFITHGGLLSTIESIHYGVPVLGIPIFGDQKMNMAEATAKGYGLIVTYSELDESSFYSKIRELLDNPKYTENIKIRSKVLRDRPMSPLDTAVYWVEYVIRHKGAPHFRSAALDLKWYQHYLLDVILFIIAAAIISTGTCYYLIKFSTGTCYYLIKFLLNRGRKSKLKEQ